MPLALVLGLAARPTAVLRVLYVIPWAPGEQQNELVTFAI